MSDVERSIPDLEGWATLQPEHDDQVSQERKAAFADVHARGDLMLRVLGSRDGLELLDQLRTHVMTTHPTYVPGWTVEQSTAAIMRRDALLEFLEWCRQEILKARERTG